MKRKESSVPKKGRKTLLNAALQRRICKLLEQGYSIKTVCDAFGIGERTFHDWCVTKDAFSAACARARAIGKIKLVEIVRRAAKKDAKHAQWMLERMHPVEFGRSNARESEEAPAQTPVIHNVIVQHDEHSDIARGIMYGDPEAKEIMQKYEALKQRLPELERQGRRKRWPNSKKGDQLDDETEC